MIPVLLTIVTIFASATWIQAVHALKSRNSTSTLKGISPLTLVIILFSETLWVSYALHYGLVGGVLNALLSLISVGVISFILCEKGVIKDRNIIAYLITAILFFLILKVTPILIVSIAATVLSTIFLIPQTFKTITSIGTLKIHGMNNYSIAMIIAANSVWIIYGIYHLAYAYIISSTVLLLCGVTMAVSKVIHHKKQSVLKFPKTTTHGKIKRKEPSTTSSF